MEIVSITGRKIRVRKRPWSGFALEELICFCLFVVLLGGIAISRYHERHLQSTTSRIHSDLQNISMAMEAYRIDRGSYLPSTDWSKPEWSPLIRLTTPVPYLAYLPCDPYANPAWETSLYLYRSIVVPPDRQAEQQGILNLLARQVGYVGDPQYLIFSLGPSRISPFAVYDPTNGSSTGIIPLLGP